jgi:phosphatidate cytidylyltransferase
MTGPPEAVPPVPAAPPRSGLGWRLATAAVGIPLLLGVIYIGGALYLLVIGAALTVGLFEFARAFRLADTRLTGLLAAATVAAAAGAARGPAAVLAAVAAGTAASLVVLILRGRIPPALNDWALALAGFLYVALLGQYFVALRWLDDGRAWVYLAAFTTFATDTGAYAVGRLLGRHKLAPRISPGKTVEGGLGGLVAGALAAVALNRLLGLDHADAAMLALGAGAAVAGQLGDLAESLIKRVAGVKDMGALLPGHGGILDRLDSLLFVVPLIYAAARWWLT